MAFLKVIKGSCPGQILELRGERSIIGRHPSCEIVLENAAVSRHHAQILESHGNYFLEDLRSRNRTYLNQAPIEGRTQLRDTDVMRICDVVFRFHLLLPEGDAAASREATVTGVPAAIARPDASGVPGAKLTLEFDAISDVPGPELEESSVISTLDARSAPKLRIDVRPETKLRAILEISRALTRVLRLEDVLEAILDGLFQIFPQADEGFVLLKAPPRNSPSADDERLIVRTTKTRAAAAESAARPSMTIARQAMQAGEAILSANAQQDPRFDMSESLSRLRIRSMMCVPLLANDGTARGVIQIISKDLRRQFSQDDLDLLTSVATQASLALENARLHEELLAQRDTQRDLEFATQVQLGFLPSQSPKLPEYEFGDYYEAALRVGGDYFDYVELADGRLAVALGDVAGKGVPAALLMARLYSAARYHLLTKPTAAAALSGLNSEIASSGLGHRFITCVLAIVDPQTHVVTIANAGHFPPLHRRRDGTVVSLGQSQSGLPLGVMPQQEFQEITLVLEPGEDLTLFTDGVTEAMSPAGEIYGRLRLMDYLVEGPASPGELVAGIVADVDAFCDERPQRDDVCLVVIHRTAENAPSLRKPKAV